MALTFAYDRIAAPGVGYPNATPYQAEYGTDSWSRFAHDYPHVIPLRLLWYFNRAGVVYDVVTVDQAPQGAWYPIGIDWFSFDCDYFALMSDQALDRVRRGELRVLFYYHEGDNPYKIHSRLSWLAGSHGLAQHSFHFVSANTAADNIDGCSYIQDHEFFFGQINQHQDIQYTNWCDRPHKFTVLNRLHKNWRAAVMGSLWQDGILGQSAWSYNTDLTMHEDTVPFELDRIPRWRENITEFLAQGSHYIDSNDVDAHNDHRTVNVDVYNQGYCHIVMETVFDTDASGGAFLTEKTFKPIKYAHPFVIAGPCGSLEALRRSGYKVFDGIIDNSYDLIADNTERWLALRRTINSIAQEPNTFDWHMRCQNDALHNRQLFLQRWQSALNIHAQKLSL